MQRRHLTIPMVVLGDRINQTRRLTWTVHPHIARASAPRQEAVEEERSLLDRPSIVHALRYDIHLLDIVLPHIPRIELTSPGVKRHPPRIAKPVGPNLMRPS